MASPSDIVIFTDDPGWHGRELSQALINKGYRGHYLSLTDCSISIQTSGPVLNLSGLTGGLPAAAFVRGVPGGTLEQVIFRLNILHILKDLGIPVMNDGRAIERTVDKAMTSYLLNRAGIPTPETHVFESVQQAYALMQQQQQWVIKPLFGSQGIGVQKLSHELLEVIQIPLKGYFICKGLSTARMQIGRIFVSWLSRAKRAWPCCAKAGIGSPIERKELSACPW